MQRTLETFVILMTRLEVCDLSVLPHEPERFYTLLFTVKKSEARIKAVSNEMFEPAAELETLLEDGDEDEGSGVNPISVPTSGNVIQPSVQTNAIVLPSTSSPIGKKKGKKGRKGKKGKNGKKGKGRKGKGRKGKGPKRNGRKGDAPDDDEPKVDSFVEEQAKDGFFN